MNALLLAGSCRKRSNTGAIARFLRAELERRGVTVAEWGVDDWRNGKAPLSAEGAAAFDAADAVVLLAPIYLDTLPAPALRLLGAISVHTAVAKKSAPAFYAVIHSGYLEPAHRAVALEVCAHFSRATGLDWQGGLGFGGTSPIDGRPVEKLGWMTKNLRTSLGLLAAAVAERQPVPERARARADKSPIPLPLWLLVPMLNRMTGKQMKKKGVEDPLATPYRQD